MKRSYFVTVCGIALLMLIVVLSRGVTAQQPVPEHPAATIGAGLTELTLEHIFPPPTFSGVLRAFVATGSSSEKCLVSLREATDPWIVRAVFCAHRVVNGRDGLLITVLIDSPTEPTPDFAVYVTVYQEFAKYYAAPVVYTED